MNDLHELDRLNRDYIASVQNCDVKRFAEILAEDFLNTNPDGSIVDKQGFLAQIGPPARIRNLACHDVNVRLFGDFAVVHARTSYEHLDGRPGGGRYTDIYARRNGRWSCIAAQVARS
jgi:ketosteroid isomerase-like protein